nr:EOG090X0LTN [Triops cancriformis]
MDGADFPPRNTFEAFVRTVYNTVDAPVTWFRERVVASNRRPSVWYHENYRRVPTIDQCYHDDIICYIEAQHQFNRDKLVENNILSLLRKRVHDCTIYESPDHEEKCKHLVEQYKEASGNWFMKYGDLGARSTVTDAYMKQKHRMIWERRHGPVGTGRKDAEPVAAQ